MNSDSHLPIPESTGAPSGTPETPAAAPGPSPAAPGPAAAAAPAAAEVPPPAARRQPRTSPIVWGALILAFCGYVTQLTVGGGQLDTAAWVAATTIGLGVLLLGVGLVVIVRGRGRGR